MLFRRPNREAPQLPDLDPDLIQPGDVLVLGPGCPRCDALYEATCAAVGALGLPAEVVARVHDLDELAAYGPILTPALVVRQTVIFSGRVPAAGTLRAMLSRALA